MLWEKLRGSLQLHRDSPAIATENETLSFADVYTRASALVASLNVASDPVAVYFKDSPELLIALVALDALGKETFLIGGEWPAEKARAFADQFKLRSVLTDRPVDDPRFTIISNASGSTSSTAPAGLKESRVVIFTSGTTGEPKGAVHTWSSLAAGIKIDPKFESSRWLVTYGLTRFAGLQVFLQAFLNGGCVVISTSTDVQDIASLMQKHGIECASGTPTFWRKFLTGISVSARAQLRLKQITLGGEIVGQAILSALSAAFPGAQITHIYASTEAGFCFSVRDSKEGFPLEYLENRNDRVSLRLENGELMIRSNRAMSGYVGQGATGEWIASGDLVEVRGDRVYFLGRKSDVINVGGSKVFPAEIEEEIMKVPGVLNVRVSGRRSSFAGQLVRAEVIAEQNRSEAELKAAIVEHCSRALAPYKRPRLIDFVARLPENDSRKIVRSNEQ